MPIASQSLARSAAAPSSADRLAGPLTAIRLDNDSPTRRRLLFGRPDPRAAALEEHALFGPGRIVGYLVDRPPAHALFLFRTAAARAPTKISGVSSAVHLLLVAATTRAVTKASTALRYLSRRSDLDPDLLSDGFWLRLADFLLRSGSRRILPHVEEMLRRERRQPV
jgi:hypothetical protein